MSQFKTDEASQDTGSDRFMLVWDADATIEAVGGIQALRELLARHGLPVPETSVVHMWKHRGSVSGRWSAVVALGLARAGINPLLTIRTVPAAVDPAHATRPAGEVAA